MILTKSLDYEEIIKNLDKEKDVIAIIGCNTCIRVSGAGGPEKLKELAVKLRSDGYKVKEGFMLPIACMEPYLFTAKLANGVNIIISLSCSAGFSNMKRNFLEIKVIETVKDMGLMVADANKGILKLVSPYEKYKDKAGSEYVIGSDAKELLGENLPMDMEV